MIGRYLCIFVGISKILSGYSDILLRFFGLFEPTCLFSFAVLLPIKSLFASAIFRTALFDAIFKVSVSVFVTMSESFSTYLSLVFLANDETT